MNFTAILVDIAIIGIILLFAFLGRSKGLVLTLCGLVAFFVALFGANYLADRFEPMAVAFLQPKLEAALTEQFQTEIDVQQESMPEANWEELPIAGMIMDVLTDFGLVEDLADEITKGVQETTQKTVQSIAAGMSAALAQLIAKSVLFLLFFVVILLLWTILSHVLDLAFKLPVLRTLNGTGGFLIGLLKGLIIVWVVVAALLSWSGILSAETIADSYLLKLVIAHNPVLIFMKA